MRNIGVAEVLLLRMKSSLYSLPLFLTLLMSGHRGLIGTHAADARSPSLDKNLLLTLVNAARKKGCNCGNAYYSPAPPLTWNEQLEAAAAVHSADMSRQHFFSHTGSDGTTAGERIEGAGYRWKGYGENIAEGYRSEDEVIKGWLISPGHCKNIMDKNFKEMGISRSGNYWTQVFASRQ